MLAGLLLMVLLLMALLRLPPVNRVIAERGSAWLSGKLNSEVRLDGVNLGLLRTVSLSGLYAEDLKGDTLLWLKDLEIDVDLPQLIRGTISLREIEVNQLTARVRRSFPDTTFNYQFVLNAFSAGQDTVSQSDTSASSMKFVIGNVKLRGIRLVYYDDLNGVDLASELGTLDCGFEDFDLNAFNIRTGSLVLKESSVTYRQLVPKTALAETEENTDPWQFGAASVQLINTRVKFEIPADSSLFTAAVGNLHLRSASVRLDSSVISAGKLALASTTVKVELPAASAGDSLTTAQDDSTASAPAWSMVLHTLELADNDVEYRVKGAKPAQGFNPSWIRLKDLAMKAEKLRMVGSSLQARVNHLSVHEQNGFSLKDFKGTLRYHEGDASAENLFIQTSHSRIARKVSLSYPSVDALTEDFSKAVFNAELHDTRLGIHDLYYFVPELRTSLGLSENEWITVSSYVHGSLADMTVSMTASWRESEIEFEGGAENLLSPEKLFVKQALFSMKSGNSDIAALLPEGTMPADLSLPEVLQIEGNFHGYLKNFNAEVLLESSAGELYADVQMSPDSGNVAVPYHGILRTNDLQLGPILHRKDLGPLTFSITAKGEGLDTSSFNTAVNMHLVSFLFKGYDYRDLTMEGKIVKSSFEGNANMRDDNLAFDFNGYVNLDKSYPAFSFLFDLKGADLKNLGLSEKDTRVATVVRAQLELPSGSNPEGTAGIYDLSIRMEENSYRIDSLVLNAINGSEGSTITLSSDKLAGEIKGNFLFSEIYPAVMLYMSSHFDLGNRDTMVKDQRLQYSLKLSDPTILTSGLIPGLTKLTPAVLEGSFDGKEGELFTRLQLAEVEYAGVKVDSVDLNLNGNKEGLSYNFSFSQISDSLNFKLENMSLSGRAANDRLTYKFLTAKDDSTRVVVVSGLVNSMDSVFTMKLDSMLVLNGSDWKADPQNLITFGENVFRIESLNLDGRAQKISVKHIGEAKNAPLELKFGNFELGTLSGMLIHKQPLATGTLNGYIILEEKNNQPAFSSKLTIRDLAYKAAHIGNLALDAGNLRNPDAYDLLLTITGGNNDVKVEGVYDTKAKKQQLDLNLEVVSLQMTSVEPLTGGELTQLRGWVAGNLSVTGKTSAPSIIGSLYMHELAFRPRMLDSYLRIPGGELSFTGNSVNIKNFTVFDTLNNKAILNGVVNIADPAKPAFNLKLRTSDFLAMNTDKSDNQLYYGRLFLDSDVQIKGTLDQLTVDAKAKLNPRSSLTYVKPQNQILKDEAGGIVEFTDSLEQYTRIMTRDDSTAVKGIAGMELNAEINVDRQFDLKVIVDPVSGDSLYIRGGGRLNFSMDRSGSTSLSGKYNITRGNYFLTISDFVKRDFTIQEGSSVTWSGDPLDAFVDLSAIYRVKASPLDLVQGQMAGITEVEAARYRNLLEFDVFLKMSGFISSPHISFDIQLAPQDRGALGGVVNTRLAQLKEDENQLNKQVFALLTLRRFVSENPLESSSGGGLSSAGRSSASKVLTQQLNTLSDRYVNFVDLDLGVNSYEDYSGGRPEGRTQVEVGVSKQLFNERVTVRVGGNVDVEGERAQRNTANDIAGNINIDYKLTEDGRYSLQAFRENQYENPIEGEIIRTGTGIVFTRDFNKFRNLFRKPREQRLAEEEKRKKKEEAGNSQKSNEKL